MKQKLINHIILVLDESSSMSKYRTSVIKNTDEQVAQLRKQAAQLGHENRISIYRFNSYLKPVVFDTNVDNFVSIAEFYYPSGNTALYDAIVDTYREQQLIPQHTGDHSFLFIIVTDGEENSSKTCFSTVRNILKEIESKDNITFSIMVPNAFGKYTMEQLGFKDGNIAIWDTVSERGYEEAVERINYSTVAYVTDRSTGVKKTSNFFSTNTATLTSTDARKAATVLKPGEFTSVKVDPNLAPKTWISNYCEEKLGKYRLGKTYYMLTKPEKIQPQKAVLLRDKKTGDIFHGPYVRQLINLPDYELKVAPGDHGNWDIFVQSTAINRHLVPGTELIALV